MIARRDCNASSEAGLNVDVEVRHEGLVEAIVGHEDHGSAKIQWVASGAWNFFYPVPDPMFGCRLHMGDLAVNKALAAGERREFRDYVDLAMIHEHVMPLWHAVWAAPAKDESSSPIKLLEKIAATNRFRQIELDERVVSTVDLSMEEIGTTVRRAVEEARQIFTRLPGQSAGRLFVDAERQLVNDVERILAGGEPVTSLDAAIGGAGPLGLTSTPS
ncbi:hypothetical protein ACIQW5_18430 [Methylorubrum thiocyanatum]|uniref:hypothetical protein n=1 Tax=Methylorubrum thiocyanatum TaxID=47958 RepID=UPI00383AFB6F